MFNFRTGKLISAKSSFAWVGALGFALFAQTAAAVPFANPLPATLLDDLDGDGYFEVGAGGSLSLELFDTADGLSLFGFYEQGDPGTLTSIFDNADVVGSVAIVDFAAGAVIDFDLAAVQSIFTPPTNNIGFFYVIPGANVILFSDPTLNPGGVDFMAAHTAIGDGTLNLLFQTPGSELAGPQLLSWYSISGVTGVPVPAPSSIALMLLGLAVMGRRKILK